MDDRSRGGRILAALTGRFGALFRGLGAAALLVASAGAASAQVNVTQTYGFEPDVETTVVIECTRGPSPLTLTINSSAPTTTLPQIPTGAACRISSVESTGFPTPEGCHWESQFYPGAIVIIGPNLQGIQVHSTLVCPPPIADLTVVKTVAGATGSIPANATFNAVVQCDTGTSVLPLAAGGTGTVAALPVGTNCSVVELPPSNVQIPAGCRWDTTYPAGSEVTVPPGGISVQILNTLVCPPQSGTLTVVKTVVLPNNTPYGQVQGAQPFRIDVVCTANGAAYPVTPNPLTFQPAGPFQFTYTGLPAGASCQITERNTGVPPGLGQGCRWEVTYPAGQIGAIAAGGDRRLEVRNQLVCPPPPANGSLTVIKTIVLPGGALPYAQVPGAQPFRFDVTCTLNGAPVAVSPSPLTIQPAGPYQSTYSNLPNGAACSVVERPATVPQGAPNCQWQTTYPNGQNASIASNQTRQVEVVNTLVCPPPGPPSGDLGITKTGPGTCQAGASCPFSVAITNFDATPYEGPVAFTDTVSPPGPVASASSGWFCSSVGGVFTCFNPLVNLAAGATVNVQVSVAIPGNTPANTSIDNCATLVRADASVSSARFVQGMLSGLGYDVGPIDGAPGPRTRAAAQAFQRDYGLAQTGNIDQLLIDALESLVPTDYNITNDNDCDSIQTTSPAPPPPNCPFGQQPVNGVCANICGPNANWNGQACIVCGAPAVWDPQTLTCVAPPPPVCQSGSFSPSPPGCACQGGTSFVPLLGCVSGGGPILFPGP